MSREIESTLAFSKNMVRIPSVSGDKDACRSVLDMASEQLGHFPSREFISNGVVSRLFYNTPEQPNHFRVILNGHLDVVPATERSGYIPNEQDGKLYGRGAGDMKGAVAAQIAAFCEVAQKIDYPLGLMLVTDEEINGENGTGYQVSQGVRTDFVIAGEPTRLGICHPLKGRLGLRVVVQSTPAHAAYPGRVSASIDELALFMVKMRDAYPTPPLDSWQTSAAVTNLGTSHGATYDDTLSNTIPGSASCDVDVRYTSEEGAEQVLALLASITQSNTTLREIHHLSSAHTDPTHPDIVLLRHAIHEVTGKKSQFAQQHGSCDFRWFTEVGAGGVAFGPIAENIHGDGEYVDIASLVQYQRILTTFLKQISVEN
jgi:succinyl-diaminopimelate desuccinylase